MDRKLISVMVCGGAAAAFALHILLALPAERVVTSLGVFVYKLVPFFFAATAIALFEPRWLRYKPLGLGVMTLCFLIVFCVFVPKVFFHLDDFEKVYYTVLVMVPFLILSFETAYRLGGGSTTNCLKFALAALLLMLSGLEDLAFLTINDHIDPAWATIPEVWNWASHMTVRLGGVPPTKYQAFVFIAVHVVLALLVLFFPVEKTLEGIRAKSATWSGLDPADRTA